MAFDGSGSFRLAVPEAFEAHPEAEGEDEDEDAEEEEEDEGNDFCFAGESLGEADDEDHQVWLAGSACHVAEHCHMDKGLDGQGEEAWRVTILMDAKPPIAGPLLKRCIALKTRAAWEFIAALPGIVEPWTIRDKPKRQQFANFDDFEHAIEEAGDEAEDAKEEGDDTNRTKEGRESPSRRGSATPALEGEGDGLQGRRRGAVLTLAGPSTESPEDAIRRDEEAYFPEKNRLQSSLTAAVVRDIAMHICDAAVAVNPPWNVRVASVEAALLAWDLTSTIYGACRVPLTLVTQRGGRQYAFVFVLVMHQESVALIGRYLLKELSYLPLEKRKLSDAVEHVAAALTSRHHELKTLYLGQPSEALIGQPGDDPTYWRVLKLSCRRQEWNSILASCDFYVARRQEVSAFLEESTVISQKERGHGLTALTPPPGLDVWLNSRSELRLKVVAPLLVRRRLKQDKQARRPRPVNGGVATMEKKSVSTLSMRMGRMEQKEKREQDQWHQLAFHSKHVPEPHAPAMEWPPIMETECSSVSSDSLEEYAEDFRIDKLAVKTALQVQTGRDR